MRAVILSLTAIAVLAAMGVSTLSQAGEPLMQRGAASVTPGDDTPTAAVDSLLDEVSPTATANTTATDQVDDDMSGTPALDPVVTDKDMETPAPARDTALPPAP